MSPVYKYIMPIINESVVQEINVYEREHVTSVDLAHHHTIILGPCKSQPSISVSISGSRTREYSNGSTCRYLNTATVDVADDYIFCVDSRSHGKIVYKTAAEVFLIVLVIKQ